MLTPRSGSHSFALAALQTWWPQRLAVGYFEHPANLFPEDENFDGQPLVALIVRNPVARFRSMCAHRPDRTVAEHLDNPLYCALPRGPFAAYFRFEDQLDAAAEWLGLPTPLPQESATAIEIQPALTREQETRVRELFSDDIQLWESLQ